MSILIPFYSSAYFKVQGFIGGFKDTGADQAVWNPDLSQQSRDTLQASWGNAPLKCLYSTGSRN